jgi:hypothetical protein
MRRATRTRDRVVYISAAIGEAALIATAVVLLTTPAARQAHIAWHSARARLRSSPWSIHGRPRDR